MAWCRENLQLLLAVACEESDPYTERGQCRLREHTKIQRRSKMSYVGLSVVGAEADAGSESTFRKQDLSGIRNYWDQKRH